MFEVASEELAKMIKKVPLSAPFLRDGRVEVEFGQVR
jgi:hypothetical protein